MAFRKRNLTRKKIKGNPNDSRRKTKREREFTQPSHNPRPQPLDEPFQRPATRKTDAAERIQVERGSENEKEGECT